MTYVGPPVRAPRQIPTRNLPVRMPIHLGKHLTTASTSVAKRRDSGRRAATFIFAKHCKNRLVVPNRMVTPPEGARPTTGLRIHFQDGGSDVFY
jgi:hypothetical protein